MEPLQRAIASLDLESITDDEHERLRAVRETKQLLSRLQKPYEKMYEMVWCQPLLVTCMKVAYDSGLFFQLKEEGRSIEQLAPTTGVESELLHRIMRMLVVHGIVTQSKEKIYYPTDFSQALSDKDGLSAGIPHLYDSVLDLMIHLPRYFESTGYRNPIDNDHPPFESWTGTASRWKWYEEHPTALHHFQSFLAALRQESALPVWTTVYPVEQRLLDGVDWNLPIFVDVGGGAGWDCVHLNALVGSNFKPRIILQDLPEIIKRARNTNLPSNISLMPHNFFDAQPAETAHARAYMLHSVLHDWPDSKALAILSNLKSAMRAGYSKILIYDSVVPEQMTHVPSLMATMDILMMANFAAHERTETQWRRLADEAGLNVIEIFSRTGRGSAVIELSI